MARKIATTIALVALLSVLLVRGVALLTDSPVLIGLAIVVVVAGAAFTGLVVASRVSAAYSVLLRRQQALAVEASHELRTPITALRLSLEDMTLWKDVSTDVTDELHRAIGELDRLSDAVTAMLDGQRDDHRQGLEDVDLSALASAAVSRWRTTIDPDRSVRFDAPGSVHVRLDAGTVRRVLAAQLDQFDGDGTGDVEIEVVTVEHTVRVRVCDESAPRFATGVIHGPATGKASTEKLTIAEAGNRAEAMGGYLGVEDAPTTCLSLILPVSRAHVRA